MDLASKLFSVFARQQQALFGMGLHCRFRGTYENIASQQIPAVKASGRRPFRLEQGRILQAYQVIFIAEGRGLFESSHRGRRQPVEAGSVILLFPGVWHRFAPDPQVGWVENWIECHSTAYDFARTAGLIDPSRSLLSAAPEIGLVFEKVHSLAVDDGLTNWALLSTRGLEILALLSQQRELSAAAPADRLVELARQVLMEGCTGSTSVEEVARRLGVSYSYFRRVFKDKTGVSPKQYLMLPRIRRAQDLMLSSDKSIKEIAGILEFSSALHLSSQFQQIIGLSPSEYRRMSAEAGQEGPC